MRAPGVPEGGQGRFAEQAVARILHRPVCGLLGSRYPLVLAGMGGVARADLVNAVTRAGGFGLLGMVREPTALIREEVRKVRAAGDASFGVSLIPAATDPDLLREQVDTLIELRVPAISLFWDLSAPCIERCRGAGMLVLCQVGSVEEALDAQGAGAQVLIVQGVEAGGHVRGDRPLAELLNDVLAVVRVPVLAAGGLADGADVASVLSLGAQGAVLGTALIPTHESFAHPYHQQRIVDAPHGATLLTQDFHINWPAGARVRVLPNSVTRGQRGDPFADGRVVIGSDAGRPIYLFSTDSPLRSTTGDLEAMALYAGEGAAKVDRIVGAEQRVRSITSAAAALLGASVLRESPNAPRISLSSPVCYAEELDDAYRQSLSCDALLEALNELLEAERAGARTALALLRQTDDKSLAATVRLVHRGEVQWCGVLMAAIHRLGGSPSTRTGDFYGKVMALPDLRARLALLNRGQAWVARRLEALVPRIDDDALCNALAEMLRAHRDNIDRVDAALPAAPSETPST
ncbi:nitronate monooxygenase [Variovorax sp. J31P207]|uniref:nitronate monooxygenase n=1 Tax=Variovorax sp. J31P207 TaxID=3053510 RepID=UPI002574B104|nr:nitronate monooxygenase [Variovorax sp. J31P207]MDM0072453.1 nitronate monooxygenase [Variovorax sp. J31P207]